MTCIAGYIDKKNNCTWLGSDSICTSSGLYTVEKNPKAFKYDKFNNVIIGASSSFRCIDLLRWDDSLIHEDELKKEINHKFMVEKFVPRLIKIFQNGVYDENSENRGAYVLIGIKDKMYEIQTDYSVLEREDGIFAIGSGSYYAISVMRTIAKHYPETPPEKMLWYALEAVENICTTVKRPFHIINTMDSTEINIE